MLDTTPTSIKGVLQRGRASLERRRGEPVHAPQAGSDAERPLVRRFAEAFTEGNVAAVVSLLTDDAWLAMPPAPHEYVGPHAISEFLRASFDWRCDRGFDLVPAPANMQPAFGCYLRDGAAQPAGIVVLTLAAGAIRTITRFPDGRLNARFGLPAAPPDT